MLLELLSDFQISIPELGRIEARTHPVVLLTSNNSRELTEALKRRCLYLWLDYPTPERELEIVHLHAPEPAGDGRAAGSSRSSRWCASSTSRSRRRSRSRSTGRARCCCSARRTSTRRPSATRSRSSSSTAPTSTPWPSGSACGLRGVTLPRHLIGFADALRTEGVAIGTSELNDAFAALGEVEWTRPGPFKEALAATLAKSPDDRRVFDLVFERYFFRATEGAALEAGVARGRRASDGRRDGDRIDFDALREQILEAIRAGDEAALRDLARLAIAAFGRRGEGSGVLGVDVQRIRRALGLKSEPQRPGQGRGRARRSCRSRATRSAASRPTCGASSSARRSSARRRCRRPPAERARPRAAVRPRAGPRRRAPRRHAAQAPARHPGPPGPRPRPPRPRRRAPDDARLAGDRRRPGRPEVQAQAPAPPRALRALRRLHERHVARPSSS